MLLCTSRRIQISACWKFNCTHSSSFYLASSLNHKNTSIFNSQLPWSLFPIPEPNSEIWGCGLIDHDPIPRMFRQTPQFCNSTRVGVNAFELTWRGEMPCAPSEAGAPCSSKFPTSQLMTAQSTVEFSISCPLPHCVRPQFLYFSRCGCRPQT